MSSLSSSNSDLLRVFEGYPLDIRWHGWRSDTHSLKRQGWEVLASQEMHPHRSELALRIGLRDKANRLLISGVRFLDFREMHYHNRSGSHGMSMGLPFIEHVFQQGFDMQVYHADERARVHSISHHEFESMSKLAAIDPYAPVDLRPAEMFKEHRLGELKIFKDAPTESKEIYIPYGNVDECLNRILELQFPEQEQIKKNLIMPEKKPLIQAKIFTLAA